MGRRTKDSGVDGLVVVDKPAGWTSHDIVAKARGAYRQRRAGHSGTLDPDATGVLLIGFGTVTRLLPHLTALRKTYTAQVVLGSTTSTLDAAGEVTATFDMSGCRLDELRAATSQFIGDIEQIPPMVSAIQIGGVRLHELARQGIEVERAARPVTVYRYDVMAEVEPGVFSIEVECGSGTYVRSLAADLGTALGGGAHLRNLRRPVVGSFDATRDGVTPDDPRFGTAPMLSPAHALRDYPSLVLSEDELTEVRHGRQIPTTLTAPVVGLHDDNQELVGVAGASEGRLRPFTVFARTTG
jgi:tRNA pseudouridine55 synthase